MSPDEPTLDLPPTRRRRRIGWLWLLAPVLVLAAGGAILRGGGHGAPATPVTRPVTVVTAAAAVSAPLHETLTLVGSVTAAGTATVAAGASGPVSSVAGSAGEYVQAGQLLVSLGENPTLGAQLAAAQATLSKAQAVLSAAQNPPPRSPTPPAATVSADQAAVTAAQAQLTAANQGIAALSIVAPVAGTIAAVYVSPGGYVGPSTPVVELLTGGLQVQARIPPTELAVFQHQPTLAATVSPAVPNPASSYPVSLAPLPPFADPTSGQSLATFDFTGSTAGLVAGEPVTVSAGVGLGAGLTIPAQAVVYPNGAPEVFEVTFPAAPAAPAASPPPGAASSPAASPPGDAVGTVQLVGVTLGVQDGDLQQVTAGLSAGALVVTTGQTALSPGDSVAVAR